MLKVFIGGTVIDGTGTAPRPDCMVVVEGSKIVEVSQRREELGPEALVIDVRGKTVMPGLIDCHTHFAPWIQWLINDQGHSLMYLGAKTTYFLKGVLESGVTTARDLGGLEAGFVEAQAKGLIPGPRLQTSLVIISPTNGLLDCIPGVGRAISPQGRVAQAPGVPLPWCDGPNEARKKVREVLRYGADVIKIANTGTPYDTKLAPDRPHFTVEELEAICDEAHKAGVQVNCHVMKSRRATLEAVRAGVDIIDHGTLLDEECVEEMARRGVWLTPMFSIAHWHTNHNPNPAARKFNAEMLKEHLHSFALAFKGGVPIAMGTDAAFAVGVNAKELEYLVQAGMTPMQAITASTGRAAECLRMKHIVGTLEAGKEADLLIIDGNPLQDITALARKECLSLVMQAGVPMAGPMVYQFPWKPPQYNDEKWLWS